MTSRLVVSTFLSLDGVMQAPGGPGEDDFGGFGYGGWLVPHVDDDFNRIMAEQFDRADAMLVGRRTYSIMAAFWPDVPDDQGSTRINSMRKYVATRHPLDAEWQNTEVLLGEAAETVADLKDRTDGEILVQGSSVLNGTLQEANLVDEYRLLVFPVVLGQGKRLFDEGTAPAGLRLMDSTSTRSGVVYSTYESQGEPRRGSL